MRDPKRRRSSAPASSMTAGDHIEKHFMAKFGVERSQRPFHTTARRECGGCRQIKPGSEFDWPVTPGRADLNNCRRCAAH